MDISNSVKDSHCIGSINIFSGRPNPTWDIDDSAVRRLRELWTSMDPYHERLLKPPPLGYGGCLMRCNDEEWFAYSGAVTLKINEKRESRSDKDRRFEKLLLNSAPTGLFPSSIIENEI